MNASAAEDAMERAGRALIEAAPIPAKWGSVKGTLVNEASAGVGLLPSPEARELAQLLVRKAEGDEAALLKLLDDREIPDELLGFHLQQAVEKRLKAVLALHSVEYERTHSISYLTEGARNG